jgi:hypothetical protein
MDYRILVEDLHDLGLSGQTREGWTAERLGRNPVWRLTKGERTIYAKQAYGQRHYSRELYGLKLGARLAEAHPWITAAEFLYGDSEKHIIVTGAISGSGLGAIMRSAFRIDRNPFHRAGPIAAFKEGLDLALNWLRAFHSLPFESESFLFDHTAGNVRDRLVTKLERAITAGYLSIDSGTIRRLQSISIPRPTAPPTLISGDASIGNFIWDGMRIGRIDFEDIGFGSPAREFAEVRADLTAVKPKPWYWSTQEPATLLPPPESGIEALLNRLEWQLDRHWPDDGGPQTRRMRELAGDITVDLQTLIDQ